MNFIKTERIRMQKSEITAIASAALTVIAWVTPIYHFYIKTILGIGSIIVLVYCILLLAGVAQKTETATSYTIVMVIGAGLLVGSYWVGNRRARRVEIADNKVTPVTASRHRVPIIQLREIAGKAAWNVDRHTSNDSFDLTNKLNQAAVDGTLQFWGRKYEYEFAEDAAESVPLIPISREHFLDYSFESTNLFGDANNFYIFTGKLSKQPRELKGMIYRDIHVDPKQIEAWLPHR